MAKEKPQTPDIITKSAELHELRAFITRMVTEGRGEDALDLLFDLLGRMKDKNNDQALRIATLLRQKFGRSSEKITREQLDLFLQSVSEEDRAAAAQVGTLVLPPLPPPEAPRSLRKRNGRNPLPSNLPRTTQVIDPTPEQCTCEQCGQQKERIGFEISELLEFEPAGFRIIELRRVKLACKPCQEGVVVAPVADKPIERGRPGPGLLAHVAVSKYQDHLPLYRLSGIYARAGVPLAPSTLGTWIAAVAEAFEPIYKELLRRTLASYVLGVDDTGLRVLDSDHPNGVKRGHLWAYVGYDHGRPVRAFFDYTETWEKEGPCAILKERTGYIQGDGYKGIDDLFKGPNPKAVRVGCMGHARRKFKESLDGNDPRAAIPLQLIGRLYEVEALATARKDDPVVRQQLRDQYSRPVMAKLKEWIADTAPSAVPKSPLGRAITYAVNQWPHLVVYLEDGAVPIDNVLVEQRIRPVAVGRKNYLFAGSDEGARRASIIYSILANCTLADVEPFAYLRDVLDRLSHGWPASRIAELLPQNWKPPVTLLAEPTA